MLFTNVDGDVNALGGFGAGGFVAAQWGRWTRADIDCTCGGEEFEGSGVRVAGVAEPPGGGGTREEGIGVELHGAAQWRCTECGEAARLSTRNATRHTRKWANTDRARIKNE